MHFKRHYLLVIILLIFSFSRVSAQKLEKIPFSLSRNGHIIIQTNITDKLNGRFILDTGAGFHLLAEKHKKNLNTKSAGYFTAFRHTGERVDFEVFQLPSIKLGSIIEKEPCIVFWNVLEGTGIDGIYSLKIIENQPVTLDLINNNIIIETEKSIKMLLKTGKTIAIEFQRYRDKALDIFAYFKINDKITAEFEIDTGSGNSIIIDKKFLKILGIDSSGAETEKDVRKSVRKISLSDAPEISLADHVVDFKQGLIYDGIIGNSIWLNKKLTIDVPHKRIIINSN